MRPRRGLAGAGRTSVGWLAAPGCCAGARVAACLQGVRPHPSPAAGPLKARRQPPPPPTPHPSPLPAAIFYALTFPVQRPQLFVLSWPYFPQLQVSRVVAPPPPTPTPPPLGVLAALPAPRAVAAKGALPVACPRGAYACLALVCLPLNKRTTRQQPARICLRCGDPRTQPLPALTRTVPPDHPCSCWAGRRRWSLDWTSASTCSSVPMGQTTSEVTRDPTWLRMCQSLALPWAASWLVACCPARLPAPGPSCHRGLLNLSVEFVQRVRCSAWPALPFLLATSPACVP